MARTPPTKAAHGLVRARLPALVASAIVAIVCLLVSLSALAHPREDFDLMAYVGVVHAYDGEAGARERTLGDLRDALTPERYAWMTGRDFPGDYAHWMAYDDRSFAQQLVWFRGRPLFTRSAWLVSKLGVKVPRALHLVTLLSTLALAAVTWVALRPRSPDGSVREAVVRSVAFFVVAGVFHFDELAASPLSDPLGAALALAGLGLLARDRPRVGLGLMVVAVLARSDAAMYPGLVAALALAFAARKRPFLASPRDALIAAALAFGARAWVERGSYGWAALVHFRRVHFEPFPADARHTLDASLYLRILKENALELYTCEVVALVAFVVVVAGAAASPRVRALLTADSGAGGPSPAAALTLAMVPLSVARFFAFPDWHSRFFVVPLGLFFVGLAHVAQGLAKTEGSRVASSS